MAETTPMEGLSDFYPRPPGGGRPSHADARPKSATNFYPRPPGGGRQALDICYDSFIRISIHALRVEGDFALQAAPDRRGRGISIHALRVEGDLQAARRQKIMYISIHAIRVEGDVSRSTGSCSAEISIHALRVEGDINCGHYPLPQIPFLSTPSGWRATFSASLHCERRSISIHALRVEGDRCDFSRCQGGGKDFYPRPPGGGRPICWRSTARCCGNFYPRPPGGGRLAPHCRSRHL